MRINSSKSIAALMAVCVGTLSSVTAMAATITTDTTYDYTTKGDPSATVYVTSNVDLGTINSGKQITYLVSLPNPTTGSEIYYIDQQKANSTGSATFEFQGKQSVIYGGTVQAKFGTDGTLTESLPTFTFTDTVNYYDMTVAQPTVTVQSNSAYTVADALSTLTGTATADNSKIYWGKLAGNASGKVYGITIDEKKYQSYGCGSDGLFCIVLNGATTVDTNAAGYVEDAPATSSN